MHRIARDDMARNVEFFQQFLHGRDLVLFFVDLDMRQNQSRVDSKRAEHLFCLDVVEVIETTLERLTIERHNICRDRTRHGSGRPHVDERHFQHPQGSAPAKYTGWRYERVAFSI